MEKVQSFIGGVEDDLALQIYNDIFLSADVSVALLAAAKETVVNFITRAVALTPSWTTTRCAVVVENLTGLAMVAASAGDYNTAWLCSLALGAEVELGTQVQLSDRQAEVAFKLARLWKNNAARPVQPAGAAGAAAGTPTVGGGGDAVMAAAGQASGEEEDEEEEEEALPWEEQLEELPADLRQVLNRLSAGTLVLDARCLMEQVPHWAGLKQKPEVNNHRQDQHKKLDRVLQTLQ